MAFSLLKLLVLLQLCCSIFFFPSILALKTSSSTSLLTHLPSLRNFCNSRRCPDACFDSLKLSMSININLNILTFLLHSLQTAISEAGKLNNLFWTTGRSNIIEKQRGAIQDCKELHQITLSSLERSVSRIQEGGSQKLADARVYLSAAHTNKNTCLEGLDSATGPLKPFLVNSLINTCKHVSNSLSMLSSPSPKKVRKNRRLLGFPKWISKKDAADGTGNFTTISDAINFAPNNSYDRVIIFIREGIYDEKKHQAVALRIYADLAALYRCTINGYQDTLYVHSFRQFYRECNISGTIDYIFGKAAVVFQACKIISRMPMPGQFTNTGISIQNCPILATDNVLSNSASVKSYLGRPWRVYSRTVILEFYIDDFIDPTGWTNWFGDQGLDGLYYGEYDNYGPGSAVDSRVTWPGFHIMDAYDVYNFTVSYFITGDEWLHSTSFPYDDGIQSIGDLILYGYLHV
ncbi:hypothetical protein P3X46_007497 [Hevea brasiliensis]|uniref:Pectinesterase n=1 Tax=Hevea brasiliensis TaxID=3981 RepID=A0ABQ9MTP5_HEVBR|nr:hypothetical protein P3X46_007497 [Hevea brasiliensis]